MQRVPLTPEQATAQTKAWAKIHREDRAAHCKEQLILHKSNQGKDPLWPEDQYQRLGEASRVATQLRKGAEERTALSRGTSWGAETGQPTVHLPSEAVGPRNPSGPDQEHGPQ